MRPRRSSDMVVRPLNFTVRPHMEARHRPQAVAILLALFWAAFAATLYTDWHPGPLSKEAQQYLTFAEEVNYSGLSLRFAAQKLSFLVGIVSLLSGSILLLAHRRPGALFFTVAAIPLAATVPLGESEPYYPVIESLASRTLWCITTALWGAAVALAWVERGRLSRETRNAA